MATSSEPRQAKRMIPVRACHRCDAIEDVFHLTMVDHLWLCRDCHKSLSFPGVAMQPLADESLEEEHAPQSSQRESVAARLHRVDTTLRWGGFVVRILIYAAFLLLAQRHPLAENLLFGFFIADAFGWMVHAWWDAHFHGRAITVEAVFFTVLFIGMQQSGLLDLPLEFQARALACGAALLTLGTQLARFYYKLRIEQP